MPLTPIACIANWRQLPPRRAKAWLARFSPAEQRRLERFAHEDARRQFIAGRCLARELLSLQAPETERWQLAASGPPHIAQRPDWQLSISHSGDWIGAALGPASIGIDLEATQRPRRHLAIARRYFHDEEARAVAALAGAERERLFQYMGTAREAYLKALETGIADGLQRLRVEAGTGVGPLVSGPGADWSHHVQYRWTAQEPYLKAQEAGIAYGLKLLRVEEGAGEPPRVVVCGGNGGWRFLSQAGDELVTCVAWEGPPLT